MFAVSCPSPPASEQSAAGCNATVCNLSPCLRSSCVQVLEEQAALQQRTARFWLFIPSCPELAHPLFVIHRCWRSRRPCSSAWTSFGGSRRRWPRGGASLGWGLMQCRPRRRVGMEGSTSGLGRMLGGMHQYARWRDAPLGGLIKGAVTTGNRHGTRAPARLRMSVTDLPSELPFLSPLSVIRSS